ncbi:MAG TPA: hypothetical protein VIF12_03705 [Micavibrio sp.]|jgi:hypothetical protein
MAFNENAVKGEAGKVARTDKTVAESIVVAAKIGPLNASFSSGPSAPHV